MGMGNEGKCGVRSAACGDQQIRAGSGQVFGDGTTDAGGGSGDEGPGVFHEDLQGRDAANHKRSMRWGLVGGLVRGQWSVAMEKENTERGTRRGDG